MTSSTPVINGFNTERLFITGVGEVDASVFNRLREAGDKVCGEVETECVAKWLGAGCKIARAVYPVRRVRESVVLCNLPHGIGTKQVVF